MNGRPKALLLIPLSYNDGAPVQPEILEELKDRLFVEFKGYRIGNVCDGAYEMQDGTKREEPTMEVWIVLAKNNSHY